MKALTDRWKHSGRGELYRQQVGFKMIFFSFFGEGVRVRGDYCCLFVCFKCRLSFKALERNEGSRRVKGLKEGEERRK